MAFTGQTTEEMLGSGWTKAVHPEDLPVIFPRWMKAVAVGSTYTCEARVRRYDGEWRWMSVKALPIRDERDQLVEWFGVMVDITGRRNMEEAFRETSAVLERRVAERTESLRESEERFRQFMDNSPMIAWVKDEDGRYVYQNQKHAHWAGVQTGDWIGKDDTGLWPPALAEDIRRYDQAVLSSDRPIEIIKKTSDDHGEPRYWLTRKFPFRDAKGRRYVGGTGVDITEQRKIQKDLEKMDRFKDDFLATLAHELRTPLASIYNAAYLLKNVDNNRLLDIIARQASHLMRLADDLLDRSRISRGKISLRQETVSLGVISMEGVEACRSLIDKKQHRVAVTVPDEPLYVCGDPDRLLQIVINLVNNAAKYTPPGGDIVIGVARESDMAVLRVRDNGKGIPASALKSVFDFFSQVEDKSDRGSGLGIGLSVVQKLVSLHGGGVEARSEGLGKGAEFIVSLPLAVEQPGEAAEEAPLSPAQETNAGEDAPRVLIIENDRDFAAVFSETLEALGAMTRVVGDGPSGIAILDEFGPDLIFLDIDLPGLDGYETARRIRARNGDHSVTLAALTGKGRETDIARARDAGCDMHFTKPASIKALEQLLARARRNRR